MKQFIIQAIIKMGAKSIALTTVISIVIGMIGHINRWNSSIAYSNAFFLAGSLLIIAGTASKFTAGQEWNTFQVLSADSFRGMSSGERAQFIIDVSSSLSALILGVLSGLSLILISAIAAYLL